LKRAVASGWPAFGHVLCEERFIAGPGESEVAFGYPELVSFFFVDDLDYDVGLLLSGKNITLSQALKILEVSYRQLVELDDFSEESLEKVLRPLALALGLKTGDLFGLLRVAITGRTATPPLFKTMSVLGKDRCLKRIQRAIGKLESMQIV